MAFPPQKVCTLIQQCPAQSTSSVELLLKNEANPNELGVGNCAVCKEIVGVVESELASNSTETEIAAALNTLCQG